jgi:hypothetical protein
MAIEIVDFRKYEKNSLQGFLTIRMDGVGLEIRDIALHQKDISRWLQMPSKPYKDGDGNNKWSYIIHFYDKDRWNQFQKLALEALDTFLVAEGDQPPDEDIPF